MKRKGFTLVELLVVIAIIALLMGILMPALAEVRRMAQRVMCGTKLKGLGTAMIVYANENEEDYPSAGGKGCTWSTTGHITDWDAPTNSTPTPEAAAFGKTNTKSGGQKTVTSDLYLLIKYASCTPKQFVCAGDDATEFKLDEIDNTNGADVDELAEAWDFGGDDTDKYPGSYCSYSYNAGGAMFSVQVDLYSGTLTVSTNPSKPVAADRNPFMDDKARGVYVDGGGAAYDSEEENPKWEDNELIDQDKVWNSAAHGREGQNVLFADSHVEWVKKPNVGIENDNIWKYWADSSYAQDKEKIQFGSGLGDGVIQTIGQTSAGPGAEQDSWLINESNHSDGKTLKN